MSIAKTFDQKLRKSVTDARYRENNHERLRLSRIRRSIGPRSWTVRGRCSVCKCESSYQVCGPCNRTEQRLNGWKYLYAQIVRWLEEERG